jgi:hypothetical protein
MIIMQILSNHVNPVPFRRPIEKGVAADNQCSSRFRGPIELLDCGVPDTWCSASAKVPLPGPRRLPLPPLSSCARDRSRLAPSLSRAYPRVA